MTDWKEQLLAKKLLLADGGWGTELAKHGLPSGEAPEGWNLDHADEVRAVAAAYVEAGSDIILTNTFGGTQPKLEKCGLGDKLAEVNRKGVEISREAAGDKALVFASIGPTGEMMEPYGTASEAQMIGWFAEQAGAIASGGADGIVIETVSDLNEAKAALKAARQETSLSVAVSFTYDKGARGYATMMGVTPEQAAEALDAAGADIIGANCGLGPEDMVEIARLLRSVTSRPLWCKANAGLPQLIDGKTVFLQTPEDMARHLSALVGAGANIVGGCCGSTPDHIRRLAQERVTVVHDLLGAADALSHLRF